MRLAPLLGICTVAWGLVLLESYLFFGVIIPLSPGIHSIGAFTISALFKVGLTLGLGVVWFAVNILVTRQYMRSRLKRLPPTSSS